MNFLAIQATLTQFLQIPISAVFVFIFLLSIPISNLGFRWMYLVLTFFYAYQSSLSFPSPTLQSIILAFGVFALIKTIIFIMLAAICTTLPIRMIDLIHQSPFSSITTPIWKFILQLIIYLALFEQMHLLPDLFTSSATSAFFENILDQSKAFSFSKISLFLASMLHLFQMLLILLIPTFAYSTLKLIFDLSLSPNHHHEWFKSLEIIIEICFWLITFPLILNLLSFDLIIAFH
jgi:hypothetical protein